MSEHTKEREEFEAYMRETGHPEFKFRRIDNGDYDYASTALFWEAWQHQQQRIAELQAQLYSQPQDEVNKPDLGNAEYAERWARDTLTGAENGRRFIWGQRNLAKAFLDMKRQNAELRAVIKEADDYLDTNNLTSIGSGSILHRNFKALGQEVT